MIGWAGFVRFASNPIRATHRQLLCRLCRLLTRMSLRRTVGEHHRTRAEVMTRQLVPIPETRELLGGIGHTTAYDLINRGELVRVKIGRRSFVTAESIAAYVNRLSKAASA